MPSITESELANIAATILAERPNGEATFAVLINEIPKRVTLSAEDLAPSTKRPGEGLWEQRVRNITSHKSNSGKVVSIPGGLRLVRNVTA